MNIASTLSMQFDLQNWQIENLIRLFDEGNTIPFIARYRKEAHGSLDDQTLRKIAERLDYLRELEKRKEQVRRSIEETGNGSEAIWKSLEDAQTLAEIEDLYRPFRPKRKTRASVAKEKGLDPLAAWIWEQSPSSVPDLEAAAYVYAEKGVADEQEALQGAQDILAEQLCEDPGVRKRLRALVLAQGVVSVKAVDPEKDSVYTPYYEFEQPVRGIASHRILAIDRGEREGFLKVSLKLEEEKGLSLFSSFIKGNGACSLLVQQAAKDGYRRLLFPSIEREIRSQLTEQAVVQAIQVFAVNLRQLLLQPPVKGHVVMGLDPGYRTGCKLAVVDATGRVLETGVIYPTHSQGKIQEAKRTVQKLCQDYHVSVIAIGNGTASRETERFVAETIAGLPEQPISYIIVNEAGASVYSASPLGAEEFPDFDVTLRSAISIARRLQDPLAELVKIDPKSIGVGQYQHDMPNKQLSDALNSVVEDCVNHVGVELNTASPALLSRVAGIQETVSKNIVAYREKNGPFRSRDELKNVPKLGPKAFEQCAGFLRIQDSENLLDRTGVHPESYPVATALLQSCGFTDIASVPSVSLLPHLSEMMQSLPLEKTAEKLGVGLPTLQDICAELVRPGRDPREELPPPLLRTDVMEITDIEPGMEFTGTVRNVIDFGAFVDIGVHQDGLVHISQICDRYIRHPSEVLQVGDLVRVRVLEVDPVKKRISFTMKIK